MISVNASIWVKQPYTLLKCSIPVPAWPIGLNEVEKFLFFAPIMSCVEAQNPIIPLQIASLEAEERLCQQSMMMQMSCIGMASFCALNMMEILALVPLTVSPVWIGDIAV